MILLTNKKGQSSVVLQARVKKENIFPLILEEK